MLVKLNIKNVALIDEITIDFRAGMNCISGETGAGKTIIIDSLNVILGGRATRELIRTGNDIASVEAVFNTNISAVTQVLQEMGIEEELDNSLVLYREFSITGKNNCKINGRSATLSMLKRLGEVLVDLHGQHDNQSLLRVETHQILLDMFAGNDIRKVKDEYYTVLMQFKDIRRRMNDLLGDPTERTNQLDLLTYQVNEIMKANLKVHEAEELSLRRTILMNSEKIAMALNKSYKLIFSSENDNDSALDQIKIAQNELYSIAKFGDKYSRFQTKLEEIGYQLEELSQDIREENELVEYNYEEQEQIDERIDIISKLKRKYGRTIEDILIFCKSSEENLHDLKNSDELIEKLIKEADIFVVKLIDLSKHISILRNKAGIILEQSILIQLEDLEMKKSNFVVQLEYNDKLTNNSYPDFTKSGLDKVEFLVSANLGEPVKQLSKIASGGELSRIMLAIKTILADVDDIPILIFDEIDIGISGQAARKVGEKMKHISKSHQVICVTHLAQIAAIADHNIYITKVFENEKTKTKAQLLDFEGKVLEICRLLDGNTNSEITAKHAREMIESF